MAYQLWRRQLCSHSMSAALDDAAQPSGSSSVAQLYACMALTAFDNPTIAASPATAALNKFSSLQQQQHA